MSKYSEHIDFRAGDWKFNVYLDGELIHSFDDRCGDIWAALKCRSCDEGSEFVDELIDEVQQSLVCSGKRKLTVDEIEALKRKMLDIDNLKGETKC